MIAVPCLLFSMLTAQAPTIIDVEPRRPFGLIAYNPSGRNALVSHSEVVAELAGHLSEHTSYRVLAPEAERIESALKGRVDVVLESARLLKAQSPDQIPDLLLFLFYSPLASEPGLEVTAWVLDTKILLRMAEEGAWLTDEALYELETRAAQEAVPASVAPHREDLEGMRLPDREGFSVFVETLITSVLRPEFEARSAWHPYGEIELTLPVGEFQLSVDDRPMGPTPGGRVSLRRVRFGTHILGVRHPEYENLDETVTVSPGVPAQVALTPRRRDLHQYATVRDVTFWTGAVLGTLGAGALAYALARNGEAEGQSCFSSQDVCSVRNEYVSLAGMPVAPIGGTLAAAGLGLVGGVLIEPDEDLPWKTWVVSVGLGLIATSVAVAAAP
jgi:hypothetical protein